MPTSWSKTIDLSPDLCEEALEFLLLQSRSMDAFGASKLRKWRISGVSASSSGDFSVQVHIHIADDGWISMAANQGGRHLKSTSDTDNLVQAPVEFASPSTNPLDPIIRRIQAGELAIAEEQLTTFLEITPENLEAWELLATLIHDPARKVDCYRQILLRDPGNRLAAAGMASLADINPKPAVNQISNNPDDIQEKEPHVVKCPRCGGDMRIKSLGKMRPKASCFSCDTELDLPGWFTQYYLSENNSAQLQESSPGTVQNSRLSVIDDDMKLLTKIFPALAIAEDHTVAEKPGLQDLTPEDIIKLAGGPLPTEERQRCHNCDAVISRDVKTCPWCSTIIHES